MRNDRDPYWRRRDESYWRGRQKAHASYWKLTRQIRKSEHRGRRHAAEVDRLSSDIEARRRADRQAALIAQMHKERQWLQGQIAACSSGRRDRWLRQLELFEPTAIRRRGRSRGVARRHRARAAQAGRSVLAYERMRPSRPVKSRGRPSHRAGTNGPCPTWGSRIGEGSGPLRVGKATCAVRERPAGPSCRRDCAGQPGSATRRAPSTRSLNSGPKRGRRHLDPIQRYRRHNRATSMEAATTRPAGPASHRPRSPQSRVSEPPSPPASALPLTARAARPTRRPLPRARRGSRPPPGSATLPQDPERPVNAVLDYIPRPCYPRQRRPPAGPPAMTDAAAPPRPPQEARAQHARGQGALVDECAQARPAGTGVRHPARGGQGRVGRSMSATCAPATARSTPPRRSW